MGEPVEVAYQGRIAGLADRLAAVVAGMAAAGDVDGVGSVMSASAIVAADLMAAALSSLAGVAGVAETPPAALADAAARAVLADVGRPVADVGRPVAEIVGSVARRESDRVVMGAQRYGASGWEQTSGVEVAGWLRRTQPGDTCGLCVAAATRVYRRPDLDPIHDRCRCTIRPILEGDNPGDLLAGPRRLADDVSDLVDDVERRVADSKRVEPAGAPSKVRATRASNVRVVTPDLG